MVNPSKVIDDAFFAQRSVRNEHTQCIEWNRHLSVGGYGTAKHKQKNWLAHRLLWTYKFGPIPNNKIVCHKCDNRRCINPDHLFIGITQDNVNDKMQKGRNRPAKGEDGGNAKLTNEQIYAIRIDPRSQYAIAKDYGITQSNVSLIKAGKGWAHIEKPPEDKKMNVKQFAAVCGLPYQSLKDRIYGGYMSVGEAVARTATQFNVSAWQSQGAY